MTRTDKDRAFRIQKPPGYFPPQAWHRLRHATPRRNDACIAKACFFAGRLAVDHRDGQSAFSQLQGTADADYAGTDHNHLITVCPSACSHHPCKPVSNGLSSCPLPTNGGPFTCYGLVSPVGSGTRLNHCISSVRRDLGHHYRGCKQRRIQCGIEGRRNKEDSSDTKQSAARATHIRKKVAGNRS